MGFGYQGGGSGGGSSLPLSGGSLDENAVVRLFNGSRFQQSTPDKGVAGSDGFSIICSIGYEYKFALGYLFVLSDGSSTVRKVLYAPTTPTTEENETLGYVTGTTWETAEGAMYICTNASAGAWALMPAKENAQTPATQNEAENGGSAFIRSFSPLRIKQAIHAQLPGAGTMGPNTLAGRGQFASPTGRPEVIATDNSLQFAGNILGVRDHAKIISQLAPTPIIDEVTAGDATVELVWSVPFTVPGLNFIIRRGTENNYNLGENIGSTTALFFVDDSDSGEPVNDILYYYWITPVSPTGIVGTSTSAVTATPTVPPEPFIINSPFDCTIQADEDVVRIDWSISVSGAVPDSFQIWRTDGTGYQFAAATLYNSVGTGTTTYWDTEPLAYCHYFIVAVANNPDTLSDESSEPAGALRWPSLGTPDTIVTLSSDGPGSIDVETPTLGDDYANFNIYRNTDNDFVNSVMVITGAEGATNLSDISGPFDIDTTYYYWLKYTDTLSGDEGGTESVENSITIELAMAPVADLAYGGASANSIDLSWSPFLYGGTSQRIFMNTVDDLETATVVVPMTIGGAETIGDLTPETEYYFWLAVVNDTTDEEKINLVPFVISTTAE